MKSLRNLLTTLKPILFGLLAVIAMQMLSIIIVVILQYVIPGETQYTIPPGNPNFTVRIRILHIMYYLTPFIGGFAASSYAKQKGWLYGVLMGIILIVIAIIFTFLFSLTLHSTFTSDVVWTMRWRQIRQILLGAPIVILLTTAGGILGQRSYEKK